MNDETRVRACLTMASVMFGVEPEAVLDNSVKHAGLLSHPRRIGIYLANTVMGLSYEEIARVVDRDRSTVRLAIEKAEDERDDPVLDNALVAVETLLMLQLRGELVNPVPLRLFPQVKT